MTFDISIKICCNIVPNCVGKRDSKGIKEKAEDFATFL